MGHTRPFQGPRHARTPTRPSRGKNRGSGGRTSTGRPDHAQDARPASQGAESRPVPARHGFSYGRRDKRRHSIAFKRGHTESFPFRQRHGPPGQASRVTRGTGQASAVASSNACTASAVSCDTSKCNIRQISIWALSVTGTVASRAGCPCVPANRARIAASFICAGVMFESFPQSKPRDRRAAWKQERPGPLCAGRAGVNRARLARWGAIGSAPAAWPASRAP